MFMRYSGASLPGNVELQNENEKDYFLLKTDKRDGKKRGDFFCFSVE